MAHHCYCHQCHPASNNRQACPQPINSLWIWLFVVPGGFHPPASSLRGGCVCMTLLIPVLTVPYQRRIGKVDSIEPIVDCKFWLSSGGMHSKLVLAEAKKYHALDVDNMPAWWNDINLTMAPKGTTARSTSCLNMHLCTTSPTHPHACYGLQCTWCLVNRHWSYIARRQGNTKHGCDL